MTILVGVLCQEGVVVGSDSAATLGAPPQLRTIQQPDNKVFVYADIAIVATTGMVGHAQRVNAIFGNYWEGKANRNKDRITIAKELTAQVVSDFQHTGVRHDVPVNQPNSLQVGALMAYPERGAFHLCEHPVGTFQPEFKTEKLWYTSMGSGQMLCDPFLGFLRQVFWPDRQPTLSEGIFAATWALRHAISLNPGGIADPLQLATLTRDGKRPFARILQEAELEEHATNAADAESYLSRYFEERQASDLPVPPQ